MKVSDISAVKLGGREVSCNAVIAGFGALDPSPLYPHFSERHKLDCMPVDFFIPSNLMCELESELVSERGGWYVRRMRSLEFMVGECASIALAPSVPVISWFEINSGGNAAHRGGSLARTAYYVVSAAALTRLSDLAASLSTACASWALLHKRLLGESGGAVITAIEQDAAIGFGGP